MLTITNVMAVSLDGAIGNDPHEHDSVRRSSGFTNEDDKRHVENLLRQADAVILGGNSLRTSGEIWNLRNARGHFPTWVVLSNAGLAADLSFWQQNDMPRWIVSREGSQQKTHSDQVRTLTYNEQNPALLIRSELEKIGAQKVLLFGGAAVNNLFYSAGIVDELSLTLCPMILARHGSIPLIAPNLPQAVKLHLLASEAKGDYLFLHYRIIRP